MIRSSARRPTTNGLIERENGVLEIRLMTWMAENERRDWATAIAEIKARRNQEWTRTINCSPFQMFFTRDPYAARGELAEEEEVDFDLEEDFAETRHQDNTDIAENSTEHRSEVLLNI